ncbi:hypothetical protein J8I26_07130 [Herbaspirillum sp. LeCh32-8]|nr:hypothetical protein [Herbaspirillum sp. LeCh32-8]
MTVRRAHVRIAATQTFAIPVLNKHSNLQRTWHLLAAETLFWGVTLALLLEDDVAMLAVMFS